MIECVNSAARLQIKERAGSIWQKSIKRPSKTTHARKDLYCVNEGQKDGRKKSETLQEAPVKCSNSSEASGEDCTFV